MIAASTLPFALLCAALGFTVAALIGFTAPAWLRQRPDPWLIGLLVGASAVVALFSPGAPTSGRAVDAVLRAGFAAVVTAAGSKARRAPLLVTATGVAVAVAVGAARADAGMLSAASVAVAAATFGGAVGLRLDTHRYRLANTVVAGGIAHAVLRLPTSLPMYVPTVVAVLASAVVLGAAQRRLRSTGRRRANIAVAVAGGAAVFASLLGVFALAQARSDVESGVKATKTGLDLAEGLDIAGATRSFDNARVRLERAAARTGSWAAKPAYAIPVLAQNLRAVNRLSGVGADLSSSASVVFGAADLERLRPAGGVINVEAIRELATPLADSEASIDRATNTLGIVDGPWVVGPIKTRTEPLHAQLAKARSKAQTGARAAEAVPSILGGDAPRRYLLVVPTPAEMRGGSGVLGNFGELEVDRGQVRLARFDRISNLQNGGTPWEQRTFSASQEYTDRYDDFTPKHYFNNLLVSPDFPTDAAIIAEQYPQAGGRPIDGVLSIDPFGLAALLEITGPVTVTGWPVPIDSRNAPSVMLNEIYAELLKDGASQDARLAVMQDVSLLVFQKLTSMSLPAPSKLAAALGPLLKQRRIQMWMADPADQAYITGIGGAATVPPVVGDVVGVVGQNGGANKIDYYLHRTVSYDATVQADGTVDAVTTVKLRNDAPGSGLPGYIIGNPIDNRPAPDGTNIMRLSVYSPLAFTKITYEGRDVTFLGAREFGRNVASSWIDVPPGGERTLTFTMHGKVPLTDGVYRLDVMYQPMVNADTVSVKITTPGGWNAPKPGSVLRLSGDSLLGTFNLTTYSAVEMRRNDS